MSFGSKCEFMIRSLHTVLDQYSFFSISLRVFVNITNPNSLVKCSMQTDATYEGLHCDNKVKIISFVFGLVRHRTVADTQWQEDA